MLSDLDYVVVFPGLLSLMSYLVKSNRLIAGTNKRFWSLWFLLSALGFIGIFLAFFLLQQVVAERLDKKVSEAATLVQERFSTHLKGAANDLALLTASQLTKEFLLNTDSVEKRNRVDSLLLTLASTHASYDQIRLISSEGLELSRVNFNGGQPKVVAIDQLQNKAHRYYFKEATKVGADEIYVSQLDLNIEDGKVELPHKPVIRLARPIYDDSDTLLGVVVLNLFAETLLDEFRSTLRAIPGERMLLNKAGYWLSSDSRAKEWGFMFDNGLSFAKEQPDLWARMSQTREGVWDADEGRVQFYTFTLLSNTDAKHVNSWKMVVINTDHRFGFSFLLEHLTYLYPLLVAYPFGSILLWFWARADSGREIAEKELKALNRSLERQVKKRTAELDATQDATIMSLANLAGTRDDETGQHIRRTQHYVSALGNELKTHPDFKDQLTDRAIELIVKSAALHDIGKVGIPDVVLRKKGKLDDDEQVLMRAHTTLGANAIEEAINSLSTSLDIDGTGTFLHYAHDIAHYHHERWDGTGYPKGLSGDMIPLAARIMAIADVYDALASTRIYKDAFSKEQTENIIINQSEGQFDPRLVAGFVRVKDKFWDIHNMYRG